MNSKSMGHKHKGQHYEKLKNGVVHQEARSRSLPNVDEPPDGDRETKATLNGHAENNNETNGDTLKLLKSPNGSPTHESWFNTWPERSEKQMKTTEEHEQIAIAQSPASNHNLQKFTFNEALKNITLAYSPITKQLHLIEHKDTTKTETKSDNEQKGHENKEVEDLSRNFCNAKIIGHRRNNQGSFSSTVSTISDPSPSGSLLESDDRELKEVPEGMRIVQTRKSSFSDFINKNVFVWKNTSAWRIFGKNNESQSQQTQNVVSSSALIPNTRPAHLPAKDEEEELRHREEYKAMLEAAKRKEAINSVAKQKHQKLQLQIEEQQSQSAKHFMQNVLNNWDAMYNTRKTRDLWWHGLPSSVRGRVWRHAIGNDLHLTPQLYEICLSRAQNRLNNRTPSELECESEHDQESSMDVIQLDISRTFPSLCIFQEGGPYSDVLHSLLAAYVCYRPDVGYVQGMSFIAAVLILNMEEFDAFVCFANLLNRPLHISAFTLNQTQMQAYYNAYNEIFNYNLPKLYNHFECSGLTPDLYLLDWMYTIFAKAMPLDLACRIWDLFLRDGDEFLFRTALGILNLNQELLMKMDFLHGAQFLTRLPDDLPIDQLFKKIYAITTSIGKQSFSQIVERNSTQ